MQYLGKAVIKLDSEILETMPGASIDLGGVDRKPVKGANRMLGYAEEVKEATVECEVAIRTGLSTEKYRNVVDATVSFEADTGQKWVVRNAFVAESLKIEAQDGGKLKLKLVGQPADEQ